MKKLIFTIAILATLSMSSIVLAQRPGGGGGPGGGQRGGPGGGGQRGGGARPASPLMMALDVDKDGALSAEEIANATKMLQTLDSNGDGALEASEMAPARGQGQGGGRGGQGGGRGGDPSERINRMMEMDTDGDGRISTEEGGEKMSRFFGHIDGNADGFVTREEIEQAMSSRGGRGGGGGRGGRGGGQQRPTERPAFE